MNGSHSIAKPLFSMNHFSTKNNNMFLSILFCVNVVFASTRFTSVVFTKSGPVRGEIVETPLNSVKYAAFRGIKYAEAPIGYHRFKPPTPVKSWAKILDVIEEQLGCVQETEDGKVIGSEDCLYLNVFTPVTNFPAVLPKLKAVIVWIYGGKWLKGTTKITGPEYIMEKDVVFVSFSYRAGALGWLNLNHPNATGNAALKDQLLVLKWIRTNIREFGGNPNNVTLVGGSTGAISAGYHVISDASVGLFHGAILMSGVPLSFCALTSINISHHTWASTELALRLGANSTDEDELLQVLYNASPDDLVSASRYIRQKLNIFRVMLFGPTIEDSRISSNVFLSDCPITKYMRGNYSRVPQIMGFMDEEGLGFIERRRSFSEIVHDVISIQTLFGIDVPEYLSNYSEPEKLTDNEYFRALEKEVTATYFASPIDQMQRIFAADNDNKPIYTYHISFYTNRSIHMWENFQIQYDDARDEYLSPEERYTDPSAFLGSGHGDDLQYTLNIRTMNVTFGDNDPLLLKLQQVTTMWSNFAKYGDPTPHWVDENPLGVTWPNSGINGLCLNIGDELIVEPRPINDRIQQIQSQHRSLRLKLSGCSSYLGDKNFNGKSNKEDFPKFKLKDGASSLIRPKL